MELIFLLAFAAILILTGVTMASVLLAIFIGFVVMMVFGMLGLVIKWLPWLIGIALIVALVQKLTR